MLAGTPQSTFLHSWPPRPCFTAAPADRQSFSMCLKIPDRVEQSSAVGKLLALGFWFASAAFFRLLVGLLELVS